jgi:hypothetical protein
MWQIITIKCLILKRLPIQLTTENKSYTCQQRHPNSTKCGCFGGQVRRQSTKWGCFGGPVRRQSTKWGWFEHFLLPQKTSAFHIHPRYCLATQHHLFFPPILRNSKMIISSPGIFHHLLRNDQIHSNSSTFRKISMHQDIIIRRVMTKFTQIPQLLERCPCIEISLSFG